MPLRAPAPTPTGRFAWYHKIPLFARILVALLVIGSDRRRDGWGASAAVFKPFSSVILRLLGALATPLIFVAVVQALYKANITGKTGLKLVTLLLTNTIVAITIRPVGRERRAAGTTAPMSRSRRRRLTSKAFDPVEDLLRKDSGAVS